MRVGLVVAAAVLVGACASIVKLDHVDGETNGSSTLPKGDDDDDATSSSGSSGGSSGSSSTGASSSSSSGGDSGTDATTAPPRGGPCKTDKECAEDDRCTNKGECRSVCNDKGVPCSPNGVLVPDCCFGLVCKLVNTPLGDANLCSK